MLALHCRMDASTTRVIVHFAWTGAIHWQFIAFVSSLGFPQAILAASTLS